MPILANTSVTPTINTIAIKHGGFLTATDALAYAAQGEAGFNFFNASGSLTATLSYKELQAEAMKAAYILMQRGYPRAQRLILVADTSPAFLIFFFACQYAGLTPCPVAFANGPGSVPAYLQKLRALIDSAQAVCVVASADISAYLNHAEPTLSLPILSFESFADSARAQSDIPPINALTPFTADDPAYIQFSSGSTRAPQGVQITQRALNANISIVLERGMRLKAEDRSFNWLPFHHNMGLVGFMFGSVYGQRSVDCLSAEHFVQNPLIWLELMSAYQTAITFSPLFGYQLAMQRFSALDEKPDLDLSALRIAGIGGDIVSIDTLNAFSACFKDTGFQTRAFLPSYGLTETTLAVSTEEVDAPPFTDMLNDSVTQQEVVSCGRPLPGFDIQILEPNSGKALPEKSVGQIWVKGPSVITSYIDGQSAVVSDEGYLYTGDLGYLYQERLFISGREKDTIIIRGRNLWAQDIEWITLRATPNLGINSVAAIALSDGSEEKLALIITAPQPTPSREELSALTLHIAQTVAQASGVQADIYFTSDKLPLTTSGKLARAKLKTDYLNGALRIIYPETKG